MAQSQMASYFACTSVESARIFAVCSNATRSLVNKYQPRAISKIDLPEESGYTQSVRINITRFISAALHTGLSSPEMFTHEDLFEATPESLSRVAQTILAFVRLTRSMTGDPSEPPPPPIPHFEGSFSLAQISRTSGNRTPTATEKVEYFQMGKPLRQNSVEERQSYYSENTQPPVAKARAIHSCESYPRPSLSWY